MRGCTEIAGQQMKNLGVHQLGNGSDAHQKEGRNRPSALFGLLRCKAQSIATLEGGCWLLACARVLGGI